MSVHTAVVYSQTSPPSHKNGVCKWFLGIAHQCWSRDMVWEHGYLRCRATATDCSNRCSWFV